jgi:hypothetical protein
MSLFARVRVCLLFFAASVDAIGFLSARLQVRL